MVVFLLTGIASQHIYDIIRNSYFLPASDSWAMPFRLRLMTFGVRLFFPRPDAILSEDDRGVSETD